EGISLAALRDTEAGASSGGYGYACLPSNRRIVREARSTSSRHRALIEMGGGYCVEVRITAMPQVGQKCCPPLTERQTKVLNRRLGLSSLTCSGATYQWRNPLRTQIEQLQSTTSLSSAVTSRRMFPQWQETLKVVGIVSSPWEQLGKGDQAMSLGA